MYCTNCNAQTNPQISIIIDNKLINNIAKGRNPYEIPAFISTHLIVTC